MTTPPGQSANGDPARSGGGHGLLVFVCFLVIATYTLLNDLKGVSTDEGMRLWIINGGHPYSLTAEPIPATWDEVLFAGSPYAYQPLYYLLQNAVMRVGQTQDPVMLRLVNIAFLWVCLQGLLVLTRRWPLLPRLFLVTLFSFNAYLLMHVLQIREYILGVAFYIWSTWLVLRLDARTAPGGWSDIAGFLGYGVLLTAGFYVQTWIVFPAVAQGAFLVLRRRENLARFLGHLALSYVVVLTCTWPFIVSHHQRVDVGRWGAEGSDLWILLSDGFHLALSGQPLGSSPFATFLQWLWLLVLAGGGVLLWHPRFRSVAAESAAAARRQGWLMLLSMAVPLAFQIGYFYKLDNLSVWPRYFIIYYFFLAWLLALAVRRAHELAAHPGLGLLPRRLLGAAVAVVLAVTGVAAVYQTRSYYRFPFYDSGLSATSNWHTLTTEVSRVLSPGDVVVVPELIFSATVSFTRPLAHPVVMLPNLERSDLAAAKHLVYVEPSRLQPERDALKTRLAALGFTLGAALPVRTPDGKLVVNDWQLLVFQRP